MKKLLIVMLTVLGATVGFDAAAIGCGCEKQEVKRECTSCGFKYNCSRCQERAENQNMADEEDMIDGEELDEDLAIFDAAGDTVRGAGNVAGTTVRGAGNVAGSTVSGTVGSEGRARRQERRADRQERRQDRRENRQDRREARRSAY